MGPILNPKTNFETQKPGFKTCRTSASMLMQVRHQAHLRHIKSAILCKLRQSSCELALNTGRHGGTGANDFLASMRAPSSHASMMLQYACAYVSVTKKAGDGDGVCTSSRRTRERGVMAARMARTRRMWPENVDRLCCRLCPSPTSASTPSNQATAGPARGPPPAATHSQWNKWCSHGMSAVPAMLMLAGLQ